MTRPEDPALPIDAVLPALTAALRRHGRAVLQAPPGAGKTTRVPLALMDAGQPGRIVMLEPRRLAARAAAERMAASLGEAVGATVGLRMRGESRTCPTTRIEVVTDGILIRMLQSDPALEGVGAVIFDEFHERALTTDLGLALVWEARAALRPDLAVLVMSATLEAAPVAALMDDAPVITAEGRMYPVETRWLDRPLPAGARLAPAAAELIARAMAETATDPGGAVLAFLPGAGDIRAVAAALAGRLPVDVAIRPLYGALGAQAQRAALAPVAQGRKLVLATAIAETSLTIADVRVVVDAGRARRARFDAASGMGRLVTERVTRAEAEQRRGRAGRVAPGVCYRLWSRGEEGALAAFPVPEIAAADLAGLALELALWGAGDGAGLAFLTPPPSGPLDEARALLADLGALDSAGRLTAHGRAMAGLPLHPRLAHMLLTAGRGVAPLAALLAEGGPIPGDGVDLTQRLRALTAGGDGAALPAALSHRLLTEARRLARLAPAGAGDWSPAEAAALAYPDRIGLRRPGNAPRWLLSGGRGAEMPAGDALAGMRLLVATDLDGAGRDARIRAALPLSEGQLRRALGDRIGWHDVCVWSRRDRRVLARQHERLGALVLDDRPWPDAPPEALAQAALDGLRVLGLAACAPTPALRRLQARVDLLRAEGADLPDLSDAGLLDSAGDWLLPWLAGVRDAAGLAALDLHEPLQMWLGRDRIALIDRLAPAAFVTPLGRKVPVDYDAGTPGISVRLQEMFGVTVHPCIGPRALALRITLLSPAGRPVQVTTDLPGFWTGAYADVRKDMRGRYPRHPWPEDPTAADPTLRAKPRGT